MKEGGDSDHKDYGGSTLKVYAHYTREYET